MATASAGQTGAKGYRGLSTSPIRGEYAAKIDWNTYRRLVQYCIRDQKHPMLWLTSGLAQFWALAIDERIPAICTPLRKAPSIPLAVKRWLTAKLADPTTA